MAWLTLSYGLPGRLASRRVTFWRRLRRLGALQGPGGLYLLPDRPDCLEGVEWLAEEVRQGGGEALVARAERISGVSDAELKKRFVAARETDWDRLAQRVEALERGGASRLGSRRLGELRRLRQEHSELVRIDYFVSGRATAVAARLDRVERTLRPSGSAAPAAQETASAAAYRGRRWVTRPRPHVDRLACAWLIRRFVDPAARIRYADQPRAGEVRFDMPNAEFGHAPGRCSFESLVAAFGLDDPALPAMAGIVRAIDLGEPLLHPAAEGVAAVLGGWRSTAWRDAELERHGIALFEGLYRALSPPRGKRRRRA